MIKAVTAPTHALWKKWTDNDSQILLFTGQHHILRLTNVSIQDSGRYTCFATNRWGSDKKDFWVTVISSIVPLNSSHPEVTPIATNMDSPWILAAILTALLAVFALLSCYCIRLRRNPTYLVRKMVTIEQPAKGPYISPEAEFSPPIVYIHEVPMRLEEGRNLDDLGREEYYQFPTDHEFEIPRDRLKVESEILGEGEFGHVLKGWLYAASGETSDTETLNSEKPKPVAVKILKRGFDDADVIALVSEIELMKKINKLGEHPNVIKFLGCCTQNGPLSLVVEFAEHGNLLSYLRARRPKRMRSSSSHEVLKPPNQADLASFAHQVAKGMEFLSTKQCVHRDLAARNILIASGMILKIADFGYARDIQGHTYYRMMKEVRIPAKWTAPEFLESKTYTTKCDVWSFGVLLFEIFSLGDEPYGDMSAKDAMELVIRSTEGSPLCKQRPSLMPSDWFESWMRPCLQYQPQQRPEFSMLVSRIQSSLSDMTSFDRSQISTNSDSGYENSPLQSPREVLVNASQINASGPGNEAFNFPPRHPVSRDSSFGNNSLRSVFRRHGRSSSLCLERLYYNDLNRLHEKDPSQSPSNYLPHSSAILRNNLDSNSPIISPEPSTTKDSGAPLMRSRSDHSIYHQTQLMSLSGKISHTYYNEISVWAVENPTYLSSACGDLHSSHQQATATYSPSIAHYSHPRPISSH